ncbi:rhomboid family protein [Fuerstiella marisgermanici]|uniref:Rhomboid protease GlpG n=1 Tax=Fuerstiella marisgermanici TaxID=1891926 RepID=A0A1P8WDC0_9PLAN|nr:rhomboid family intramembrane serine protease [Fuerstiella marisgermanici]APZ92066.1 Rhomboid protease GlpG [Fuerstiella marisgermanici]
MGIRNRPYAQQPIDQFPATPRSIVSKIIIATVAVFVLQILTRTAQGSSLIADWFAIERDLVFQYGQIWRLLTYAFCHSEVQLSHVLFNMLALYFLGRIVAQTIGQREFLWMYLAAAVFSGIVQTSVMAIFRSPGAAWVMGASGAVSAVFMLFALHYPRVKVHLFGILPVEARWLLAVVVGYDALGFLGLVPSFFVPAGATVAHAAHLGGLIFGLLYFRWDMNLTSWWDRFAGRTRVPKLRRQNIKLYNPGTQPEVDYSVKIDDILAKISREGEASLTARERRILTQASEHLKTSR